MGAERGRESRDAAIPDGLVVVGRLGRPHGVGGELRALATGPTLPGLSAGDEVRALGPTVDRVLTVRTIRPQPDHVLVGFREVADRSAAADLVGAVLAVSGGRLASLGDPDEFYVRDLIGCSVTLDDGTRLGTVVEVNAGAANDSLSVREGDGGAVRLIPFTHDAIVRLDLASRSIAVRGDLLGGGDA